jgi:thiol-disulfide isomerase/thioredoxin
MKKIFLFFSFLIVSHLSFTQGIIWESTIEGAFAKAKASKKAVFIECFHPNCPVCMALEPTLKNAEVGKFYNQNFVNYKLNLSDTKQVKFLDDRKIRLTGFPLFLFFDADKKVIHHTDPNNTPEGLIAHGKDAMNPEVRSGDLLKKYEAGNREMNTLINLSYLLRLTLDTTRNIQVTNDLYALFPKEELSSHTSWFILKKCVMDVENGFAEHWFNNIPIAQQFETAEGHAGNEQNALGMIIQSSLYSQRGLKYSLAQLQKVRNYMSLVGAGQYADGVLWQYEARALMREGRMPEAINLVQKISQTEGFSKNGLALVYLVTYFNDNAPTAEYANAAQQWLQKGRLLLKENKDLAEYHYQKARLEQKNNALSIAKQEAEQAKKYAMLAKIDLKKFNDLSNVLK